MNDGYIEAFKLGGLEDVIPNTSIENVNEHSQYLVKVLKWVLIILAVGFVIFGIIQLIEKDVSDRNSKDN